MSGILKLESLTKGNTLKQGDKTPLKYKLLDADGDLLSIAGKSAEVRLVYPDFLTIGYKKDGLTVAQDDTVTFTIDNVIPSRIYHVEIIVDDKFVFPSRAYGTKLTVDKSSLGADANIIEIVGKDVLINTVKSQVDAELQPLVTTLESAEQAETQRASEESSRASAEAQRKIDHANRSAELAGKSDKVVMPNLIENGDFSDGLNGWHYQYVDAEIVDGKVKATFTAVSPEVVSTTSFFGKSGINLYKDHEYYVRFEIEPTKETTTTVLITGAWTEWVTLPANELSVYSAIGVSTSTKVSGATDIRINHRPNGDYVIGDTYTLDNVVMIDLTETFGAGNEPTKEEMDELIKVIGYIDGEYALNNKEMLIWTLGLIRRNNNY